MFQLSGRTVTEVKVDGCASTVRMTSIYVHGNGLVGIPFEGLTAKRSKAMGLGGEKSSSELRKSVVLSRL